MSEAQENRVFRGAFNVVEPLKYCQADVAEQRNEIKRLLDSLPLDRIGWVLNVLQIAELKNTDEVSNKSTALLSDRELQVLVLVANGYSRANIAIALGITPNTSARHIANIYRKLDISSVAEATTVAISAGLVAMV